MARKYTEFGIKVKSELLRRGMSVPELAAKINTSRTYLLDILQGARPGNRHRPEICKLLNIKECD